jgi:hypothetical protein
MSFYVALRLKRQLENPRNYAGDSGAHSMNGPSQVLSPVMVNTATYFLHFVGQAFSDEWLFHQYGGPRHSGYLAGIYLLFSVKAVISSEQLCQPYFIWATL